MLYRKICHYSSRYVVQILSGAAVADPQHPGAGFFLFLSRWRNIPEVRCFLESHSRFVFSSRESAPEVLCNVWIHQSEAPETE